MKNLILVVLLLFSIVGLTQEEATKNVLEADSTWFKEIIKFPLGFAREIKYQGYEELRFAPGFSKANTPELWSYAWAWIIENHKDIDTDELEINLQYYFDGLLNLHPEYNKDKPQQTLAVLVKNELMSNDIMYSGKLKTTDTRYTNKPLILNINGEQHYCKDKNTTIVIFRLSPQGFKSDTWKKLNAIQLSDTICNH